MTMDEFMHRSHVAVKTCEEYGFLDRDIYPYNYKMKVEQLVRNWIDYENCTRSSQLLMQDELRGFEPILQMWVQQENEPFVKIRLTEGKHSGEIREYRKSVAEMFVDGGLAEYEEVQ